MGVNFTLLLILCWTLVVLADAGADLEAKITIPPNNTLDPKSLSSLNDTTDSTGKTGELRSVADSNRGDQVKDNRDQAGGSKEAVQKGKLNETNSIEQKQVGSKNDHIGEKSKNHSSGESDKKGKAVEEPKPKPKEVAKTRKEGSHGEECDASNSCKDDKNTLVACLRVPGNDSPDLSLLIQNKGNGSLIVAISAPDFVQLEKTNFQLQKKEDKKVKVTITKGGSGTDSLIVLDAGSGNCSLDFKDLNSLSFRKETDYGTKSTYINLFKRTPLVVFIVFAALLVTASAWMCVSFQKKHSTGSSSKYQKLDMELPVSVVAKVQSDTNDGWDDNWSDNWGDEEAPNTPSMPVTPSLSSKGLASRRGLNKEAWKD